MMKLLSFVGPSLRLMSNGMMNVAEASDKNPKTSSGVVVVGGMASMFPEWMQPFIDLAVKMLQGI